MTSKNDETIAQAMGIPPGCTFERIAIDNIEATAATQVRIRIDKGMVDQYTEDFKNGADFPPVDVWREPNSDRNILSDGFHRHRAAINAGREELGCIVHEGTMVDALMHALGSNAEHGFRRSNADKRHAVEMALKDPTISKLTQQDIADVCRVHRNTVRNIQNDLLSEDTSKPEKKKKREAKPAEPDDFRDNGKEVTQDEVELEELREALGLIKAFPYPGENAVKLNPTKDDVADAEYASTWLAGLVLTVRKTPEPSHD